MNDENHDQERAGRKTDSEKERKERQKKKKKTFETTVGTGGVTASVTASSDTD